MNNDAEKFRITACTLVYPYLDNGIGRFVEWCKTDQTDEFRSITSFFKAKLNKNNARDLVLLTPIKLIVLKLILIAIQKNYSSLIRTSSDLLLKKTSRIACINFQSPLKK